MPKFDFCIPTPGKTVPSAPARNLTPRAVEALLDGEAEALPRKAIELDLAGDMTALRLCMDRIVLPRKDRPTKDRSCVFASRPVSTDGHQL
jgi:hypothetical protein